MDEEKKKQEKGLPVHELPKYETALSKGFVRKQYEKVVDSDQIGLREDVRGGLKKAGEIVATETPNLVGSAKENYGYMTGTPQAVKAPFPMLCTGLPASCGKAFGFGQTVYKKSTKYICPVCGGPLKDIEFR